jgi:hypothetical protein
MGFIAKVSMAFSLTFLILVSAAQAFNVPPRPNPKMTTGDFCSEDDPDFAQLRYEEQIAWCYRNVDTSEKTKIYEAYHIPVECRSHYTIDHFIPLFMGGNNGPHNLWPEHKKVKALRQNLEEDLFKQMENGELTQKQAIKIIVRAKTNPPKEAFGLTDSCDE